MIKEEAAHRLCALLNEIEEAGHQVLFGDESLFIGDVQIAEPPCEDEPWEVRGL